ncbi:hypothetical protein C8R44DRAFT_890716 [Mycena epipterygia]|nr:hypothetical protein C8R44DRAFT_890716 [Mycena epipterygia]
MHVLRLTEASRTPEILEAVKAKPAFLEFLGLAPSFSLIGDITGPALLPLLGEMHIRCLSVNLGDLFRNKGNEVVSVDLEHPLFASLTHLDLFDEMDIEDDEGQDWLKSLSTLPALTHFGFSIH